jgi:hypothetical protein
MRVIWYLIAITLLIMGLTACATFESVGWNDLPDGSRLKMIKAQSDTIVGTDTNLTLIYHCPPEGKGNCVKASEFGGSSASFLKNLFHGAAAGAAMGAGLALSGDEITGGSVSAEAEGGAGGSAEANPRVKVDVKQYQRQDQRQHQQQQQKAPKQKDRDD